MYHKKVCRLCATEEIKDEYKRRGIPLTASASKYFTSLLSRSKSVQDVIANLWQPVELSRDPEKTLFDIIPADSNSEGIPIRTYLESVNKQNLLDSELVEHFNRVGHGKLLPVQRLAIDEGLLDRRDQLVIAGTSSGKTFVGELAGIQNWKSHNKKFIFVTPLVALSNQKYETFRKRYKSLGARTVLRVGISKIESGSDFNIYPDGNYLNADIIIATFEALDWILRSGSWKKLGDVGTLVIDEFQLLADPERGVELDGMLARMRSIYPKAQIIALSATVGNAKSLAADMKLHLVEYMKRPIPLERHLVMSSTEDERVEMIRNFVENEIKMESSTGHKGQSMVFTNTRRKVQDLASLLKSTGIKAAYYHAGMTYAQRKKVELGFEKGQFEVVTTTAALGAGADFPVSQVIFENPGMGARWISIAEYYQMSGRAGRYGMHDKGKSIMIATPGQKIYSGQEKTEEQIAFDIMTGNVEDIDGDITIDDEAEQLLAYISSRNPVSEGQIKNYYNHLFYRTNKSQLAMKYLTQRGMIVEKDRKWYITPLGRAVSSSFLKPDFGYNIAKKTTKYTVINIACEIAPIESVYLSRKVHARLEQAMKTHLSQRFLSESILDVITGKANLNKLNPYTVTRIKEWNKMFFDCGCKANPYCVHPQLKLSKLIIDMRLEGLDLDSLTFELKKRYDLFVYPGDLLNWLDEVIHASQSVARLAQAINETTVYNDARALALSIQSAKLNYKVTKRRKK
jgi:helicase